MIVNNLISGGSKALCISTRTLTSGELMSPLMVTGFWLRVRVSGWG